MRANPQERELWQGGPVPEPLNQTEPWQKPQVQATSTAHAPAELECLSKEETIVTFTVNRNVPAYPVRIRAAAGDMLCALG